jgi:hypothetical protein
MWIDPVTGWEWHRHYWLVGEIEQVPPYEALLEMKSLLEVHQLRSAETVHCYRLTDVSRAPSRRYKSLQAALKGMQIGDVLIEGGDSYSASFSFALRLMIVRVPGDRLDGASLAWELAQDLYRLWRPKEFYGQMDFTHQEPHTRQYKDMDGREAFVPGLYGYSWIVAASYDRVGTLATDLAKLASEADGVTVSAVDGVGVLARLRDNPSQISEADKALWRETLQPWVKQSGQAPRLPAETLGHGDQTPWVIWD